MAEEQFITSADFGRELGTGYFGTVHEASHPILGTIAVKTINRRNGQPDDQWKKMKADLLIEGKMLKQAAHQNIVNVYGIWDHPNDDSVHLCLEYCSGGSLHQNYEQGPIPIDRLRNILLSVAMGLESLHARGMLHRDIKPANILLDENGGAKLADFGLVTDDIIRGYASATGYTDHLAPEVHSDVQTSIKTDIWAFGMTTYRLLHGKLFYSEQPRPRDLIPQGGFSKKLNWLPHIPSQWRNFVRKCLHDDTTKRIQDAGQLLTELQKLPSTPAWQCSYEADRCVWSVRQENRVHEVTWNKISQCKHTWKAMNNPSFAGGRAIKLGGSDSVLGKREVEKELKIFFDSYLKSN